MGQAFASGHGLRGSGGDYDGSQYDNYNVMSGCVVLCCSSSR